MEVLFIVAVIGGIVALIAKAVHGHNQRVTEAWSSAATQLGMRFTPGSLMKSKSIRGEMYSNRVEVDTYKRSSGQSSQTYTRFRIHYAEALGLGLHLKEQGFFAGVASFFGSQDIELGDPQFDPQVIVKGASAGRVAEYLTPSRRLRILRLFQNFPGCEIKDHLLEWSKKGNLNQAEPIVASVRRLAFAASRLCTTSTSGQSLDRALEAQREGRLDDALQHVRETPASEEGTDPDARILEGQILEAGGKNEEAAQVFETASRESPEDEELGQWARGTTPEPAPEPAPEPVAAEPVAAEPTTGLDAATVCNELFSSGVMSFDAKRLFDERYKNRTVRWTGELRRATSYQIDMVFSSDPGTKLVLDLEEVEGSAFGRTAQAIVQLPKEALEQVRTRIGERITFEGRLLSCDALMCNLFIADGKLV